jgi:ADP-ribose pyrophosphatase YjhB (NUDIX family)
MAMHDSRGSLLRYCAACGGDLREGVPQGDYVRRSFCGTCGYVHYVNPRVVVGCIPEDNDGRVLMCRRAIEPRRGLWTFPCGFLECGESGAQGARREALEEARANVEILDLLCLIDIPSISEVHLIYRARLLTVNHVPTVESDDIVLMRESEIPWGRLAFSSIEASLRRYFADRARARSDVHTFEIRPPACPGGTEPAW